MFGRRRRNQRQIVAARSLAAELSGRLNSRVSLRLWDGSVLPLGPEADPQLQLSISGPGVVGSLLRRPTGDNLLRHFALGHIDFHGADLLTFVHALRGPNTDSSRKRVRKSTLIRSLLPFLFEPASSAVVDHSYEGNVSGRDREQSENAEFVRFHYDVSNAFYELFLDQEMVYTCGYFTDWNNSLDQAQVDKLDMTCRKLQLQAGERFLDIGFGWGGLLCHAAQHYGVVAHGITLSDNQLQYTREKVKRLGLEDRVTTEICDYADLQGTFDKVASICMYEHVGIDNIPSFMNKVNSLMTPYGRFLLQGITRPGKTSMRQFRRTNVERRLLARHVFPGAELDHLGHLIQSMEAGGFEVADVEGWRNHYIQTCRMWSERLYAQREEAIRLVGSQTYRMWLLYLVGCSEAFLSGGARLYQVLAEKRVKRHRSELPPTRKHLYDDVPAEADDARNAA